MVHSILLRTVQCVTRAQSWQLGDYGFRVTFSSIKENWEMRGMSLLDLSLFSATRGQGFSRTECPIRILRKCWSGVGFLLCP